MNDADFPDQLCRFIEDALPSIEAAEVLLLLVREANRSLTPEQIVAAMKQTAVTESEVRKYLAPLVRRGVLVVDAGDRHLYRPASPEMDEIVGRLRKAYNERPVTLIRMIYSMRDRKIRSFADAFKITED